MKAKKRVIWTAEMNAVLKAKYRQIESLDALAEELGCSRHALINHASRLKISRHDPELGLTKYTREQFEFVRKHYPDMSNRTLEVVSGVAMDTIKKWRRKYGWRKSERCWAERKEYTRLKRLEYQRQWRLRNPEKVKAYGKHVGIANCTVKKYARGDDRIKSTRSIALPRSEAARASEY